MKTFLKALAFAVAVELTLFAVAWLVVNCTSHAKEIGLCMIYTFGILIALSMGSMTMDSNSKLGKFLFSLLFVGIYLAMQALTICAMLY